MSPHSALTRSIIIAITAAEFGLEPSAIRSMSKKRSLIPARFAAMLMMREFCPKSSTGMIGCSLNKRDHSTVVYGIQRAKQLMVSDAAFAETVERCRQRIVSWAPGEALMVVLPTLATHAAQIQETPPAVKCESLSEASPIDDICIGDVADVIAMRRQGLQATERMREILEGARAW